MKGALGLRPVFPPPRGPDLRPRPALLARPAHPTGRNVRHELDRIDLVTLATADGQGVQRSATTAGQETILAALKLPEPSD